ncbi:hypothetical protein DM780_02970 (plasmid) [Blattabacterium punctulatus]|nr:hypothetical protein DM780_02970 [Blattabacterium punctulatus]
MMFFTSCNDDNLTGGHPPEEPEKTNTPTIGMAIDPPPAPTTSSPFFLSDFEKDEKEKSRIQIEELMNQDSQLKKIIEELAKAEKEKAEKAKAEKEKAEKEKA